MAKIVEWASSESTRFHWVHLLSGPVSNNLLGGGSRKSWKIQAICFIYISVMRTERHRINSCLQPGWGVGRWVGGWQLGWGLATGLGVGNWAGELAAGLRLATGLVVGNWGYKWPNLSNSRSKYKNTHNYLSATMCIWPRTWRVCKRDILLIELIFETKPKQLQKRNRLTTNSQKWIAVGECGKFNEKDEAFLYSLSSTRKYVSLFFFRLTKSSPGSVDSMVAEFLLVRFFYYVGHKRARQI